MDIRAFAPPRTDSIDAQISLERRASVIEEWLQTNHPSIRDEQAHLDTGSPQRAYWHYGYLMAIRDILGLINRTNPN
jgi:hypothetical protein